LKKRKARREFGGGNKKFTGPVAKKKRTLSRRGGNAARPFGGERNSCGNHKGESKIHGGSAALKNRRGGKFLSLEQKKTKRLPFPAQGGVSEKKSPDLLEEKNVPFKGGDQSERSLAKGKKKKEGSPAPLGKKGRPLRQQEKKSIVPLARRSKRKQKR